MKLYADFILENTDMFERSPSTNTPGVSILLCWSKDRTNLQVMQISAGALVGLREALAPTEDEKMTQAVADNAERMRDYLMEKGV